MGDETLEKKRRLELLAGEDPKDLTCQTYILNEEDHTIGNALRWMIMKNPDVDFCGYNIPHPSENKINLRIQTTGVAASDVLSQGLTELSSLCQHVLKTFEESVSNFKDES